MDINLLALEVGHARVKLGVIEAGELTYTNRVALDTPENLPGAIEQAWARFTNQPGAEVALAASNIAFAEEAMSIAQAATGQRPQRVGVNFDLDLPIKVDTQAPEKTGIDRILNVAAAYQQLGKACCVVDAGSAITVDFCDDDGTFLGGCIAPGARLQAEALNRLAPHLPVVRVSSTDAPFGTDTESAINAGILGSLRGLVRYAVEQHAMTLETWPEVIATGGDAHALFDGWEIVHAISPDLTLYGLGLAYTEHHIRHGS